MTHATGISCVKNYNQDRVRDEFSLATFENYNMSFIQSATKDREWWSRDRDSSWQIRQHMFECSLHSPHMHHHPSLCSIVSRRVLVRRPESSRDCLAPPHLNRYVCAVCRKLGGVSFQGGAWNHPGNPNLNFTPEDIPPIISFPIPTSKFKAFILDEVIFYFKIALIIIRYRISSTYGTLHLRVSIWQNWCRTRKIQAKETREEDRALV